MGEPHRSILVWHGALGGGVVMDIRFPDASRRTPTEPRATHRLTGGPNVWTAPDVVCERGKPELYLTIGDEIVHLHPNTDAGRYEGGMLAKDKATAFTVTATTGHDLVLTVWDVAPAENGPLYVEELDGG